jgi:hypothetical protein
MPDEKISYKINCVNAPYHLGDEDFELDDEDDYISYYLRDSDSRRNCCLWALIFKDGECHWQYRMLEINLYSRYIRRCCGIERFFPKTDDEFECWLENDIQEARPPVPRHYESRESGIMKVGYTDKIQEKELKVGCIGGKDFNLDSSVKTVYLGFKDDSLCLFDDSKLERMLGSLIKFRDLTFERYELNAYTTDYFKIDDCGRIQMFDQGRPYDERPRNRNHRRNNVFALRGIDGDPNTDFIDNYVEEVVGGGNDNGV